MTKGIIEFLSLVLSLTKAAKREGKQVDAGAIMRGVRALTSTEASDLGVIYAVLQTFMSAHEAKQRMFGGNN